MVSWHRSCDLEADFELFSDGSIDWTPSELAAEERRYLASDSNDGPPGDLGPVTGSRWCCMTCRSASWIWDDEIGYACQNCGGREFFDVTQPTKMETSTGVWMYVPHSPSSAVGSPDEDSKRFQGSPSDSPGRSPNVLHDKRLFREPKPSPCPSSGHADSERAESETATHDPVIDPDASLSGGRRRRRRRGGSRGSASETGQHHADLPDDAAHCNDPSARAQLATPSSSNEMLAVMRQLLDERTSKGKSDSTWTTSWCAMAWWRSSSTSKVDLSAV